MEKLDRTDQLSLCLADEDLSITQVREIRAEQLVAIDELIAEIEAKAQQEPSDLLDLALNLTKREEEVLLLISKGLPASQIANSLTLSIPTVKSHTSSLYRKLGVTSRTQAINKASELGIARS